MKSRYLLAISRHGDLAGLAELLAGATGLAPVARLGCLVALANQACSRIELNGQGVVLGTLFHRHGPARAIADPCQNERDAIARGGVETLLSRFWGGYVAALTGDGAVEILRDPSGALPCYRAELVDATLFASDIDLLLAAGVSVEGVDGPALARSLFSCGLPTVETVLDGITTVLPGTAVLLRDSAQKARVRWSPWDFVATQAGQSADDVAERLRRTVEHAIAAWASCYRKPLVSLSGGLDSSIVASSLATAGADPVCLTMFTDDPAGDERGFARELCGRLGLALAERRFEHDGIDITRPMGTHLPRPFGRAQNQAYERAHLEVAQEHGADAFFTGNGGDNVFGYSQSAAALVDRIRTEGLGAGAFRTLRDICQQTGAGPLRVARAAARLARQRPGYLWKSSTLFLHPDLIEAMRGLTFDHPWLEAPAGALPGKAVHIAGLVRVQPNLEPDRSRHMPVINPLLSQPVLEACLAIPGWLWREGGRDRAVARAAFAMRLPNAILERRIKGTPDSFCAEIVRRNRALILERLRAGRLQAYGFLDLDAIGQALRADRHTTGEEDVGLIELAGVEAWLDHWALRTGTACDPGPRPAPPPENLVEGTVQCSARVQR